MYDDPSAPGLLWLTGTGVRMDDQGDRRQRPWLRWVPVLLGLAVVVVAIVRRRQRKRLVARPRPRPPAPPPIPLTLEGLTEAEAEALRLEGQDNAIPFRPQRSWRKILRENIYTVFNLSLVGLAFAQLLLGLPLDALLSLGMIGVNAVLNIGQEAFARMRLRKVEAATRLKTTVIRARKVRSIDPSEVVLGDILVVGPGEYFLVDGVVVGEGQVSVDESLLTGENRELVKRSGDSVYAGSLCLSGRAAYKAETVGKERRIVAHLEKAGARQEELTPLERIVNRILRILLLVVAAIIAVLLFRYFNIETPVDPKLFADAASVVFSIAPASLFFMIFLTYAAGTADLGQLGALVHQARSVEWLANATTICFAKAGILTGTYVEMEMVEPPADQEELAGARIRQILGDFVRTTSVDNLATRALRTAFEGSRRSALEEAPYLAAYGWSAIAFDDDDLRGAYVLAEPQVLERQFPRHDTPVPAKEPSRSPVAALRQRLPSVGRLFRRSKKGVEDQNATAAGDEHRPLADKAAPVPEQPVEAVTEHLSSGEEAETSATLAEEEASRPGFLRRTLLRAKRILPHREAKSEETQAIEEQAPEEGLLLFAYQPELVPLHDHEGMPRLPEDLILLCSLRHSERVRPEAVETIRAFAETGVRIKVFAPGPPAQTAALLQQAGLQGDDGHPLRMISGPELAQIDPAQLGKAVRENTVIGHLTPEQTAVMVQSLRDQGETVAVVGDALNDVPAMRQASLSIARRSSSQAALSVADIILLQDSPKALLDVLKKGQRIANGLLDVLKLYLVQILYLALLILLIAAFTGGFPYASKQGTIISLVTLSIPAAILSLWAEPGPLPTRNLGRILGRFVTPATLTIGAAGFSVYLIFLQRTENRSYAQLAITYALVGMGLLLVVFLKPPTRLWVGGTPLSGDRRFTVVVIVLLVAFFFLAWLPLAQEFFLLDRLQQPLDYAIIGLVVSGWAMLVRLIWWLIPPVPIPGSRGPRRPTA